MEPSLEAGKRNNSSSKNLLPTNFQRHNKLSLIAFRQKENWIHLQELRPELRDDPDVVKAAVAVKTDAFQHASDRLRDDSNFVRQLISLDPKSLQCASNRLRKDKNLILTALSKDAGLYESLVGEDLKNDSNFILEFLAMMTKQQQERVSQTKMVWWYMGNELKNRLVGFFQVCQRLWNKDRGYVSDSMGCISAGDGRYVPTLWEHLVLSEHNDTMFQHLGRLLETKYRHLRELKSTIHNALDNRLPKDIIKLINEYMDRPRLRREIHVIKSCIELLPLAKALGDYYAGNFLLANFETEFCLAPLDRLGGAATGTDGFLSYRGKAFTGLAWMEYIDEHDGSQIIWVDLCINGRYSQTIRSHEKPFVWLDFPFATGYTRQTMGYRHDSLTYYLKTGADAFMGQSSSEVSDDPWAYDGIVYDLGENYAELCIAGKRKLRAIWDETGKIVDVEQILEEVAVSAS